MSREGQAKVTAGVKKLRSILREHYHRDDLTRSVTELLVHVAHLTRAKRLDLTAICAVAVEQEQRDTQEARS